MVASYSGNPSTEDKDAVRFLVGDTGPYPGFLLQDEEYTYLLSVHDSPLAAAASAADALCARFSKEADEVTGDLQRKCSQKSMQYGKLADRLRKQASHPLTQVPVPFAGGTSCDDIRTRESDTDRYPDIFNIGETDHKDGLGIKNQHNQRRYHNL